MAVSPKPLMRARCTFVWGFIGAIKAYIQTLELIVAVWQKLNPCTKTAIL
jgi:hypothetical protein